MEEKKQNLGIPIAIVIAGVAIAISINHSGNTAANTAAISKLSIDHPIAENLDLDLKEFSECVENKTFADEVSKQHDFGVSLGLRGTPHSMVILRDGTGFRINGAYPYQTVELTIEAALSGVCIECSLSFPSHPEKRSVLMQIRAHRSTAGYSEMNGGDCS